MNVIAPRQDHGTRACYVGGCRCEDCTRSNLVRYHARMGKVREAEKEVEPSGDPIPGVLVRAGVEYNILRCPGAGGAKCVKGGAWLKGRTVCLACVERRSVWDGIVPVDAARRHLLRLRSRGVGYKAVASACDVASSVLMHVLDGSRPIRASTERKILAVTEDAIADGALVKAKGMNRNISWLRSQGFTLAALAALLGYARGGSLQLGKNRMARAETVARVARLVRRVKRGEPLQKRAIVLKPENPLDRTDITEVRRTECQAYKRCLYKAEALAWKTFTCSGCSGPIVQLQTTRRRRA